MNEENIKGSRKLTSISDCFLCEVVILLIFFATLPLKDIFVLKSTQHYCDAGVAQVALKKVLLWW
jgi:hypothetical protein